MKIVKVDHIGIAVNNAESGLKFFSQLLGLKLEGEETVAEQKVKTFFLPVGDTEVELLEATAPDSPVAKFLEKKGEGVHHIAFSVEDIDSALKELQDNGIGLIDTKPRIGAGNKRIAFIHPKFTSGVLVELSEAKK
jgi:methylmalonyl-CoA/ethylmalonyl-CoA epimerase